jgi:hypothetical protein
MPTKKTARPAKRKGAAAVTASTTRGGTSKCGWCLDGLHADHLAGGNGWTCNCEECK